ncbi:hypothetical protein F5X99DRAFT_425705, partial [Biscogniauxia marginata]
MAATVNGQAKEDFGHRLLINIVDERAKTEPQREAFSIPRSADPKDGWKVITYKDYANAINHVSHRIIKACGHPPANTFPTIAYIGSNDARYAVIVLAAAKAGYKTLFISPRNSQEGQLSLFDHTDCRVICFPKEYRSVVQPWLEEREMQAVEVSPVEAWFPNHEVEPFPYNKTFEQGEWEPLCVMHTSGSTGIPKPIVTVQGMLAIADAYHNLPDWDGHQLLLKAWAEKCKRTFIPMPLFHAAGLYFFLQTGIYWGVPVALSNPDRPLSSELVIECLDNLDVQGTLLPPAILEDISLNDEWVKSLANLNMVVFGGGSLSRDSVFGADWRKIEGEDDVYRLVIVRKDTHPGYQGFFYTFPDTNEYDTKDLYKPHPTLPKHWIYYGRSDNVIVFSNGEKLNPVTIEHIVEGHPGVKGAIVIGSNRFQPALLVEPTTFPKNEQETHEFLESVFEFVIQANKETVAHGQIGRQFVALSNPQKPFLRAGKGTIQKASTIKLYTDEIDQLYQKAGEVESSDAPHIDVTSEETLIDSIEKMFQTSLGVKGKLEPDSDFFSAGIDSMQVINASRLLKAGLVAAGFHVDSTALATRVIYSNPTPRKLAQYIFSIVRDGIESSPEDDEKHEIQAMEALWQKYTLDLPKPKEGRPDPADEDQTVLLTGSTGMLGSYMLSLMVSSPAVKKIICLNRAEDGGKKQQAKIMKERGLITDYEEKAEFWHADMSRSDFGLPRETYERLLSSTDR